MLRRRMKANKLTVCSASALLHARQSISAGRDVDEELSQGILSLKKVGQGIDLARELGDFALGEPNDRKLKHDRVCQNHS